MYLNGRRICDACGNDNSNPRYIYKAVCDDCLKFLKERFTSVGSTMSTYVYECEICGKVPAKGNGNRIYMHICGKNNKTCYDNFQKILEECKRSSSRIVISKIREEEIKAVIIDDGSTQMSNM